MKDEILRDLIRGILNESGQIEFDKYPSISNVYAPSDKPARKLLVISPGRDNAYEWKGKPAAPHHYQNAITLLNDDIAIVVAKNSGTSIDSVLADIAKNDVLSKISTIELLGFSSGGNRVLHFMKSSGNAGKFSKFYLADPWWSETAQTASVPFASKTILMYRPKNWKNIAEMTAIFNVMRKSVESGGGTVIETDMLHPDILRAMISKANS